MCIMFDQCKLTNIIGFFQYSLPKKNVQLHCSNTVSH